jgi:hypothetical protein
LNNQHRGKMHHQILYPEEDEASKSRLPEDQVNKVK